MGTRVEEFAHGKVGGEALADPTEIKTEIARGKDRCAGDVDLEIVEAWRRDGRASGSGTFGERAVVAGGDHRIMDRWIESSAGGLPPIDCCLEQCGGVA